MKCIGFELLLSTGLWIFKKCIFVTACQYTNRVDFSCWLWTCDILKNIKEKIQAGPTKSKYALLCAALSIKSATTCRHSKGCYKLYVNYDEGKVPDEKSVASKESYFIIIKFFNFKVCVCGGGVHMYGLYTFVCMGFCFLKNFDNSRDEVLFTLLQKIIVRTTTRSWYYFGRWLLSRGSWLYGGHCGIKK